MKHSYSNNNSSIRFSQQIELLVNEFNSFPDLNSKWKLLNEVSIEDIGTAKDILDLIEFETLTLLLDECPNLDEIFQFLELIFILNAGLAKKLMEYLFVLETENSQLNPISLKESCLNYLIDNLNVTNFSDALKVLNKEQDERKIALILTDIALINEEIAKRLLWELFSKFKQSEPKRFVDALKILKWASEDLFLVISIIGTEKLLQSPDLHEFNKLLTMFIQEDRDLIYPLIIEVPDSKKAIVELINDSKIEDTLEFLKIIEDLSPDFMEIIVNLYYNKNKLLIRFSKGSLETKLSMLQLLIEYNESFLHNFFIKENILLLKSLLLEIRDNFTIEIFYLSLKLFNDLDKELTQELLIDIDPGLVTEQLLQNEDELLVINTFIAIASVNGLYLYYSLQAEFNEFIKWLEIFITKVTDLETLAHFFVSFQKIFTDAPELPLILTTVVKKLQREENLDDLGVFLGIIGHSDKILLQLILNNLLPHIKLYPTDKIGYLLMTTTLYNLETGLDLVNNLAIRLGSEYDIKLLRKAFESIILANTKVAKTLINDKNFNKTVLQKNIQQSDLLEQVLFLETIVPVGDILISQINQDEGFINQFLGYCRKVPLLALSKVISNSNWFNENLQDDFAKLIIDRNFTLEEFYTLIQTSSWSNRHLCKKIVYWSDTDDLGEALSSLNQNDKFVNKFITLLSEIDANKAEKIIFNYLQDQQ